MSEHAKMVGASVNDPHKNTATCKHVNDRLRRRAKRNAKRQWLLELADELLAG